MYVKQRATVLLFTIIWTFLAIGGRLTYLATRQEHLAAANSQSLYTLTVDTPRGTIFDRNGIPLTNREPITKLTVTPTPAIISQIHQLFEGKQKNDLLTQLSQRKPFVITSPSPVSLEGAIRFSCRNNLPYYQPAVHLIGYTDAAGQQGVSGLQQEFQQLLACYAPTTVTYTCDAVGGALSGVAPTVFSESDLYQSGLTVTLDYTIQQAAKNAFPTGKRGVILVQQAGSGQLLALYSAPNFSPQSVKQALNDPALPLLNRGLTAYNVGSVFKLCVAAAALEAGISTDRTYTCTGSIVFSQPFSCHKKEGHGTLDMTQAMALSCNTYFMDLAAAVGGQAIYDTAVKMGLGQSLSLTPTLTSQAGQLPDVTELLRSPAELANFAIGQGVLMASPLQITALTNAIVNGGIYFPPYLISKTTDKAQNTTLFPAPSGRRILSVDTAHTLLQMMTAVMTEGTGQSGRSSVVTAAGKTATAQTGMVTQNKQPINQGWFTGCCPSESPQYVITVLIEDAQSGGLDAAPVFRKLCDALFSSNGS